MMIFWTYIHFLLPIALGGLLSPPPTIALRDAIPACTWVPTTQDPGTCSALIPTTYTEAPPIVTSAPPDPKVSCTYHEEAPTEGYDLPFCVCVSGQSTETAPLLTLASPSIYTQCCEYTTWPGTTTSISLDLPPPTTNMKACMVCTPYALNGGNCNPIPDCTQEIAVATVTVGSAPVHVGALTGTLLYTAMSNALETLCPPVTQTTTSTQCSETGEAMIGGIQYVDVDNGLATGELVIKVPVSGYNETSLQDAMIASISLALEASATGSNCFNVSYTVEQFKPRDGLLGWIDKGMEVPRSLLGFPSRNDIQVRDRPYPEVEHMTMCNGAYFHEANYWDPYWRSAPSPGPSDFMNAVLSLQASNNDAFLCDFLDMLMDGLVLLAPEFTVEDVEIEEGIDTLCCMAGDCQHETHSE